MILCLLGRHLLVGRRMLICCDKSSKEKPSAIGSDTVRGRHKGWEIITAAIGSRKSTIIRFVHAHYGHIGNEMLHIKGPHGTQ